MKRFFLGFISLFILLMSISLPIYNNENNEISNCYMNAEEPDLGDVDYI